LYESFYYDSYLFQTSNLTTCLRKSEGSFRFIKFNFFEIFSNIPSFRIYLTPKIVKMLKKKRKEANLRDSNIFLISSSKISSYLILFQLFFKMHFFIFFACKSRFCCATYKKNEEKNSISLFQQKYSKNAFFVALEMLTINKRSTFLFKAMKSDSSYFQNFTNFDESIKIMSFVQKRIFLVNK